MVGGEPAEMHVRVEDEDSDLKTTLVMLIVAAYRHWDTQFALSFMKTAIRSTLQHIYGSQGSNCRGMSIHVHEFQTVFVLGSSRE